MQYRFRLQIKAGDIDNEVVFVLFDDNVRKLAYNTCSLLGSMVVVLLFFNFFFYINFA